MVLKERPPKYLRPNHKALCSFDGKFYQNAGSFLISNTGVMPKILFSF
jgi:hypothetical protein